MQVNEEGKPLKIERLPAALTEEETQAEQEELGVEFDPLAMIAELRAKESSRLPVPTEGDAGDSPKKQSRKVTARQTTTTLASEGELDHGVKAVVERHTTRTIHKNAHMLIGKLLELSEGVWVMKEVTDKKGKKSVRVYKEKPDIEAIKELLARGFGKPVAMVQKSETKEVVVREITLDI